eukprot:220514-Amphidinium_carterae.1
MSHVSACKTCHIHQHPQNRAQALALVLVTLDRKGAVRIQSRTIPVLQKAKLTLLQSAESPTRKFATGRPM